MMDMLIILVVFLLKSYASNATAIATSPNIKLPTSTAEEMPADAVSLIVDPLNITIDGEKILDFKTPAGVAIPTDLKAENATYEVEQHLLSDSGRRILPLYDALIRIREKTELLMSKAVMVDKEGKPVPKKFHGTLVIHADKSARYDLLRKVMYTAGAAEFKTFKLLTIKKDAG